MTVGSDEGKRGRSKGDRNLIVLAVEILEEHVGRADAEIIKHALAIELCYTPLKKEFVNLKQTP